MLGTTGKHNSMDINTLEKHVVPNGTSESTLGTQPKQNTLTAKGLYDKKAHYGTQLIYCQFILKYRFPGFGHGTPLYFQEDESHGSAHPCRHTNR